MKKQECKTTPKAVIPIIALVVTIVVILILAGITITIVFGNNDIISIVQKTADKTKQAMQNEQEELLANVERWMQNYLNRNNQSENDIPKEEYYYSVPDLIDKIAPADLFEYEVIEDGNFESTEYKGLPKKTARINRIKKEYCNAYTVPGEYEPLNYDIIYKENKITEELVIPYKVTIDNEEYTITEVGLGAGPVTPNVKTIIYPNMVYKIFNNDGETSNNREMDEFTR